MKQSGSFGTLQFGDNRQLKLDLNRRLKPRMNTVKQEQIINREIREIREH